MYSSKKSLLGTTRQAQIHELHVGQKGWQRALYGLVGGPEARKATLAGAVAAAAPFVGMVAVTGSARDALPFAAGFTAVGAAAGRAMHEGGGTVKAAGATLAGAAALGAILGAGAARERDRRRKQQMRVHESAERKQQIVTLVYESDDEI
jgi:hypothetical protein